MSWLAPRPGARWQMAARMIAIIPVLIKYLDSTNKHSLGWSLSKIRSLNLSYVGENILEDSTVWKFMAKNIIFIMGLFYLINRLRFTVLYTIIIILFCLILALTGFYNQQYKYYSMRTPILAASNSCISMIMAYGLVAFVVDMLPGGNTCTT